MTTEVLLKLEIVKYSVGNVMLFENIEFCINAGDRLFLTGSSGSGKTSFLRLINCLDIMDEGRIQYRGEDILDIPKFRSNVSLVSQSPSFFPGSVLENLIHPYSFHVHKGLRFDRAIAETMMEKLGLKPDLLNQDSKLLSGGEKQRVSLIRSVLLEPTILLLDEVTSALDTKSAEKVEDFILDWVALDKKRSFVWISHEQQQAERLNGRILEIRNKSVRENKI